MRENKREQLFAEHGNLDHMWSPRHAVVAYEKYHSTVFSILSTRSHDV
jgi:hypothetical protein